MNPRRSTAQIVAAVSGFFMMAVSTPCVLAMLNDLFIVGTDNSTGALIIGTFMGFVGLAGLVMVVFGLKKPVAQPLAPPEPVAQSALRQAMEASDFDRGIVNQALEREVLTIARAHHGRLTVADIAVDTDLGIDESKRLLDYLERAEVAQTHVSDGGSIVYVFPGFATDKLSAVNPMDDMATFDAALASSVEQVVFDDGMDGNVTFEDIDDQEAEAEEVAVQQQTTKSEEW